MKLARLILSVFLALHQAGAATYFVDYASGSNSNAGTSEVAPWKHAPGDVRSSGSVVSSLSAGDSVLFNGGVSYILTNSGINAGWSGATNAPITYASYGTGQAILTTGPDSATAAAYGIIGSAFRQWLVISNLAFVDIGGIRPADPIWSVDTDGCTTNLLTAPPGGAAVSFNSGLSHSRIVNNTMRGIGTWTNSSPLSGTQSVSGGGVSVEGATNLVIAGNTMSHMRTGIRFQGTSTRWFENLQITNNTIGTFVVWLIDGSAASASARFVDTVIAYNQFGDKWQHDQTEWDLNNGCGDAPHTDGIFLRNSGQAAVWTGTAICNNYFFSTSTNSSGGTAMIYLSEGGGGDVLIANNVSLNARDSAFMQVAPGSRQAGGRTVWCFHNSIFGGGSRPFRNTGTNHTFVMIGNIWARSAASSTATLLNWEAFNPITSDRNIFWNFQIPSGTYYPIYRLNWPVAGTWTTWAGWQALGYDARSLLQDPMFLDPTNAVITARNLRIGAASPARNLVSDLASIYPQFAQWLAYDMDGVARVEPFDAGAYQYTGSTPPPPPPPSGGSPLSVTVSNLSATSIVVSP